MLFVEKRKISYALFNSTSNFTQSMTYPIQPGPSFPASKTGERPNTLSSAGGGDQNGRVSGRPCLAMPYS